MFCKTYENFVDYFQANIKSSHIGQIKSLFMQACTKVKKSAPAPEGLHNFPAPAHCTTPLHKTKICLQKNLNSFKSKLLKTME